jgi:hypothetical protein
LFLYSLTRKRFSVKSRAMKQNELDLQYEIHAKARALFKKSGKRLIEIVEDDELLSRYAIEVHEIARLIFKLWEIQGGDE